MRTWSCALPRPVAPTPRVLAAAEALWAEVRRAPRYAGPTIARWLRGERSLGSKERPAVGDLVLGMIRHERALARLHPDPLEAWLGLCRGEIPDLDDPPEALAIACSVPDALGEEWLARLGPERAVTLARTLAGRAPLTLRVLREPVELPFPHRREGRAVIAEGRVHVESLACFQAGAVIVQDLGAQAIAEAAFIGAGTRVLDRCAGAGGKALALAAMGARVTAWDTRADALRELDRRARRCGLAIEIAEPRGTYDVALVDAPCSGTGVLRRHPENRWKLEFPVDAQRALVADARARAGVLVYATCSLARRENEAIVDGGWTRWPEEGGGDGFYAARISS